MAAQVTLSFVRLNRWPSGVRFHVVTNGTRAGNGDLVPPASASDPLDLDSPLTPAPIEVWPVGKAGAGLGPAGQGMAGRPSNYGPGFGAGQGAAGIGEAGLYNDYVTWSTEQASPPVPAVRDGTYKFGILMVSELGEPQTESVTEVSITVAGVPRPPRNLRMVGWDAINGELDLAWNHSLDLE